MSISIPVSHGELVDKITILEIKATRISDPSKLEHIDKELSLLNRIFSRDVRVTKTITTLKDELLQVNICLWEIEDKIRDKERKKEFDTEFIELARSVYHTNDQRSDVKRRLSEELGSIVMEEKSYQSY